MGTCDLKEKIKEKCKHSNTDYLFLYPNLKACLVCLNKVEKLVRKKKKYPIQPILSSRVAISPVKEKIEKVEKVEKIKEKNGMDNKMEKIKKEKKLTPWSRYQKEKYKVHT